MKYSFLAIIALLFISCSNDSEAQVDYSVKNEAEIQTYIKANNLDAKKTASGLYYVINEEGTGKQPTSTSNVTVAYKGYYTDKKVFDQSKTDAGVSFPLQKVIKGWIEGIPLFKEGGSGILIIPAHLAYGSDESRGVPAGSVLIFEIRLISVEYSAENDVEILKYIADNQLNATKTASGLYYVIDEPGTGKQPTSTSNVTVAYKGYYTDKKVFDQSATGVTLDLQRVIKGWTEGIPYFKEGGSGKLLIPANLGYGSYDNSSIPGGSVLIFDVKLISVN
jgi:FKBP-type peptidyl-prolyl cis-trans isomerase FkpA